MEVDNVFYAFDLLGQCYEAVNNDAAALKCYQTATEICPSCVSAWHNMGLYLKSAHQLLEIDLPNSAKFFNGAQVFIKKAIEDKEATQKNITNNFDYAIHYYRKALGVCQEKDKGLKNIILSNLTECLAQYGHHLYRNEHYKEAQKFYLEAIYIDPAHLAAISQMGMSFFKQECFQESRTYFSSILEKTEDTQEVVDAYLNIACAYRMEKKWDKAQETLQQAKTLAPEDSSIGDEEIKLTEAKLSFMLISAPQTLFSNLNNVSQNSVSKESNLSFK
ncbi:MAG: tetratricopeptide repeat protein [Tatlockia sp.]|nr:tetratricopeptide repeat protein [Tatlockia sp.]